MLGAGIPTTPAEITPEWLTAALRANRPNLRARVLAVKWQTIGEERGFTGVVARLTPRYEEEVTDGNAPSSLIAKFPLVERNHQSAYRATKGQALDARRAYYARCAGEVRFYREIAPHDALPTPRCYFAGADETARSILMLLEDLHTARGGDVLAGCSSAEAASVLAPLAGFHARWWHTREFPPFAWLPRWSDSNTARQERYAKQMPSFLARFGAQLPGEIGDIVERLAPTYGAVLAALDTAPTTIIHADLHLDNILFTEAGSATAALLIDWQSVCIGPAALDFSLFTVGSLSPEERSIAGESLLLRYHATLVANDVHDYPLDAFRNDCRLALLQQLAGTVNWLGSVDLNTLAGRERQIVDATLGDGRLIAALRDDDAAGLLRDIAKGR